MLYEEEVIRMKFCGVHFFFFYIMKFETKIIHTAEKDMRIKKKKLK